jgi:hypothetical protein
MRRMFVLSTLGDDSSMGIIYSPDVGVHGHVTTVVDWPALSREPSLTLCSLPEFQRWGGPVSHRIFREMAATSAFERLAARARSDNTVGIRISAYVVWLEPGDYPSHRPDWHIDRVGGLKKEAGIEVVDLRDPLSFPSFILTSIFQTPSDMAGDMDSPSSEFLLASFSGQSGETWADMRDMHSDIDGWLERNPVPSVMKAGDRTIISFSPRTVHRPGCSRAAGWRYLMRLGLYTTTEPCSPYPNHMVFYNPVWNKFAGKTIFRRVGETVSSPEPGVRSVSLDTDQGVAEAYRFVRSNSLNVNSPSTPLDDLIDEAAARGAAQVAASR